MKSQSQDILAKLLATENITVVRSNVATASFDIKNRVLTLPRWKKLTTEIEEMLILHEVGHALYTTEDGYGVVHTPEKRHLKGYANIIEDVRIEKKMKERYPGSRKSFNLGYTQLNERDFFGIKDKSFDDLLLIDRINLYYKAGYSCGVQFTAEEYVFVQRADRCVTEQDVIDLSEEIFEFSKQQKLEEQEEQQVQRKLVRSDREDDDEYDEVSSEDDIEDQIQPETNDAFDDALSKLQDRDSRTYYLEPKFEIDNTDPIVPYKQIIDELTLNQHSDTLSKWKQNANTFKIESNNIVNYLVKEFEMRKSATAHKRIQISKLGQLDMRKLYAYKIKEDLFKQVASVQQGKNHGMIFLLDWSGSMSNNMVETVEQVINLAMFCQKIKIPYQVFAFSDGYTNETRINAKVNSINDNGLDNINNFTLFELFSDKMSTRDFNTMVEILLSQPWTKNYNYTLNGTPLNLALLHMCEYVGKFIRRNEVEKMNLIVLTDGESNALHHYDYNSKNKSGISNGQTTIVENGQYKRVNATTILRDNITRKEYVFTDTAGQQTGVLLQMIKDRYNTRVTGFYILSSSHRNVERFIQYNAEEEIIKKNGGRYHMTVELQAKLRKDKAAVVKYIPGRDEMYLILSTNKIVDEELENVSSDMTATQISKQLTKMFTTRKTSRVVLNSFIGVVA